MNSLTLKRHNSFQSLNNRKQAVLKFNNIQQYLKFKTLNPENQSFDNV